MRAELVSSACTRGSTTGIEPAQAGPRPSASAAAVRYRGDQMDSRWTAFGESMANSAVTVFPSRFEVQRISSARAVGEVLLNWSSPAHKCRCVQSPGTAGTCPRAMWMLRKSSTRTRWPRSRKDRGHAGGTQGWPVRACRSGGNGKVLLLSGDAWRCRRCRGGVAGLNGDS